MQPTIITGIGIYSCIGQNCQEVTASLHEGRSGIGVDPRRTELGYQSPLTGLVPFPDLSKEPLRNAQRRCMAEQTAYAYCAVKEAIAQAKLTPDDLSHAALIVSNDSCAASGAETEAIMAEYHDSRRLGGFQVFKNLNSTTSMSLASIFGIGGLSLSLSAACAGGGHAIGIAHSLISAGVIDMAIVVGAQEVGPRAYAAFDALGVFSRNVTRPAEASRPFDTQRDGLVPSGGAACVILESRAHLSCRRSVCCDAIATHSLSPLASIFGYGFSTSPNIVTPSAESILAAMMMALGCHAQHVAAYLTTIFPHATSTRDGDRAEAEAVSDLLASVPDDILPIQSAIGSDIMPGLKKTSPLVVPTKALTGHECWMSGVSQVVYALIQQQGGFAAPHPYLYEKDVAAASLNIPVVAKDYEHRLFLCNAFGFGGTNASLLIAAPSIIPPLD